MALQPGRGFAVTTHDPGVVVITFDEPERMNGMTAALKRDLVETLAQAQQDDAVRVLVFTGTARRSAPVMISTAIATPRANWRHRFPLVTAARSARWPACVSSPRH